jgi:hypothetical protein
LTNQSAQQRGGENDDHRATDELGGSELPAEHERHDDSEFENEVRGCDLECGRRDEVGTLAKERARERYGGVGAGRGSGSQRCRESASSQPPPTTAVNLDPVETPTTPVLRAALKEIGNALGGT